MNIKPLLNYYYIGLGILFFVLGVTFQSGIISRKLSFIIYTGLLFSILLFMIMDKEFSFKSKWEIIDFRELFLFVAMATYRISIYKYYGVTDLHETIMCILIPVVLYMFGKYYVLYAGEDSYRKIKIVTITFGMGLMISYLISVYSFYYFHVDIHTKAGRVYSTLLMPEMGNTNATFYSFYPLLIIGLLIYSIYTLKENRYLNSLMIILGVFSAIWAWIEVTQRLPMVVLFFSLIISIAIILYDKLRRNDRKKNIMIIKRVITIFSSVIAIMILINIITGCITEVYESSILSRNGGVLLGNIRFKWASMVIKDIKYYPFGNNHNYYAPNITTHVQWVDFAYCGGIIPFLSIILYLLFLFKDIITLFFSKVKASSKMLIINPFIVFFLYASTENLNMLYYMFYVIMLFAGIIRGTIVLIKNKNGIGEKL